MKTKFEDLNNLYPSKSEWAGFYLKDGETIMLKPKSFEKFKPEDCNAAFCGLFYILTQIKKEDTNIKLLRDEVILKRVQNESVLFYYLYLVLEEVYKEIVSSNYFFYERKTENISSIKGRIDFSKGLMKNFGLEHKKVCEYSYISFQHPILSLIREYFVYFSNELSKISLVCADINESLSPIVSHVVNIFSETEYLKDNLDETIKLVSGFYDQEYRFINILDNMKILGQFYLDNHLYFSQEKEHTNLKMHGLVFNLNRPFEHIIRLACEKFIGEGSISFSEFTKVNYVKSKKTFQMKPDIWFKLKKNDDIKTIILDVKHKIHSQEAELQETEDRDQQKLDRNDLYQLISYIMTHPEVDSNKEKNIYGIISLLEEVAPYNFNYIVDSKGKSHEQTLVIDDVTKTITILPMRLGSFLVDLGNALAQKKSIYLSEEGISYEMDGLFEELGKQLNSVFQFTEDSEFQLIEEFKKDFDFKSTHEGYFKNCFSIKDVLKALELDNYYVSSHVMSVFLEKIVLIIVNSNDDKINLDEVRKEIFSFRFDVKVA